MTTQADAEPVRSTRSAPLLITILDAARELAVSERHLRQQILGGRIAAVRIGRCVRLTRMELDRIAREGVGGCAMMTEPQGRIAREGIPRSPKGPRNSVRP